MSAVGVNERSPDREPKTMLSEREGFTSRFGAQWAIDNWSTNTFSPQDFYRMAGYRVAKNVARKGLIRRMRTGTFTDEQAENFIEWVI